MGHWLDDAEKRLDLKHRKEDFKRILEYRKERINSNYERHGKLYDSFKDTMIDLARRVNNLPVEEREPYGAITYKRKSSRSDNLSYYLRTSIRKQKFEFRGLKKLFKKAHYKQVRSIFISLSSHDGFIHFELNESELKRERLVDQESSKEKSNKKKNKSRHRFMYRYDLDKIDENMARDILDWLTHRSAMDKISFAKPEFQIK